MASIDELMDPGCPLQLVKLDMQNKKVEVNEDALGRLEKVLKKIGTHKVAIVSVMGALRTGKSFILDLFLRFLRHEENCKDDPSTSTPEPPPRGGEEEFPLPAWLTGAGDVIEGSKDGGGFRFKGGMDACTEGIWVWSKPFIRMVNGKPLAVLLMDTQGAWDGQMTKEQSATIFGLTAVLSSKQIYNISMQIQEDKVENLAYFMKFAQAALRRSEQVNDKETTKKSFQELEFLVRDWSHFNDSWTVEECKAQMAKHLAKNLDPTMVVENSTAEAIHSMFQNIRCSCLPHPGLAIQKETWSGKISDIHNDFLRFADGYIRDVFQTNLDTKNILGSDMSTLTFPLIFRDFVKAFSDAAPVAMTFTQAMTSATVLMAKEQAMVSYTSKMDEVLNKNPRGMDTDELKKLHRQLSLDSKSEYEQVTIFGSNDTRNEAWESIEQNLQNIFKRYMDDNERRLEKALVAFANISLLGFTLFILDRASDWVCDWWSQTCADLSKLMMAAYIIIFTYIGVNVYLLFKERGKFAASIAAGELWKEMMRLMGVYSELTANVKASELPNLIRKLTNSKLNTEDQAKKDT